MHAAQAEVATFCIHENQLFNLYFTISIFYRHIDMSVIRWKMSIR